MELTYYIAQESIAVPRRCLHFREKNSSRCGSDQYTTSSSSIVWRDIQLILRHRPKHQAGSDCWIHDRIRLMSCSFHQCKAFRDIRGLRCLCCCPCRIRQRGIAKQLGYRNVADTRDSGAKESHRNSSGIGIRRASATRLGSERISLEVGKHVKVQGI